MLLCVKGKLANSIKRKIVENSNTNITTERKIQAVKAVENQNSKQEGLTTTKQLIFPPYIFKRLESVCDS